MSPRSSKTKTKAKPKKVKAGGTSGDKPAMDVYTGLLMAGFLAVVTGCALLAVELSKYDWTAAN